MRIGIYRNLNFAKVIGNLHRESRVKVPCCVDCDVITTGVAANLPLNLVALTVNNINFQTTEEEATVIGKKERWYHAAMKNPHITAGLKFSQIWKMVGERLEAYTGRVTELQ